MTFNQILFLALVFCTAGPIVWVIMSALAASSIRMLLRRHGTNPSAVTWTALKSATLTRKPGLASKYEMLLIAHNQAEFLAIRLRDTPLAAHYAALHDELCRQLHAEPALDAGAMLSEWDELHTSDFDPKTKTEDWIE